MAYTTYNSKANVGLVNAPHRQAGGNLSINSKVGLESRPSRTPGTNTGMYEVCIIPASNHLEFPYMSCTCCPSSPHFTVRLFDIPITKKTGVPQTPKDHRLLRANSPLSFHPVS